MITRFLIIKRVFHHVGLTSLSLLSKPFIKVLRQLYVTVRLVITLTKKPRCAWFAQLSPASFAQLLVQQIVCLLLIIIVKTFVFFLCQIISVSKVVNITILLPKLVKTSALQAVCMFLLVQSKCALHLVLEP
jgi:hypothetical protein